MNTVLPEDEYIFQIWKSARKRGKQMLKVLGRANSINVQKVMWCTAELGVSVSRSDIGGAFGGNDTDEYLAKNPNGKIPTLIDGDFVLWESNTIVRYLCERHGEGPWFPQTVQERGGANQWMDWYLTSLHPFMTIIFWQLIRTAPEDQDLLAVRSATEEAGKLWQMLDNHLADRAFILGDAPSMADVPLGCAAYRWHEMDVDRPDLANLKTWYQRLAERDHYRKHVMLPLT
jgi:glutathione S-transferase